MSGPADLVIRLARPEERDVLEALQRRASLALGEYNEQLEAEPDAIQLPIEQIERGQVIVAELGDRIAGFAAVLMDDDGAELDGLFVEPEHWRKGIGATLVDVAVHEARRQGLAMMVIANPSARGFYEKCGFALEGEAQTRFGPALRMSREFYSPAFCRGGGPPKAVEGLFSAGRPPPSALRAAISPRNRGEEKAQQF